MGVGGLLSNMSLPFKFKLLIAAAVAVGLLVAVPSAQSQPARDCETLSEGSEFCLEKTVSPNPATVGEPITFTVTETKTGSGSFQQGVDLVDVLPPGVEVVSVTQASTVPAPPCTVSGNTVTCPPPRTFPPGEAFFTLTIEAITTQCGTFTNTATEGPEDLTVEVPFTVQGCGEPPPPPSPCPPASQEFEQADIESGDVEPAVGISNAGDNANLSPAALQSANTGNVQNAQGVAQSCSETDDIEFEGSSINLSPSLESETNQAIEQAAAS